MLTNWLFNQICPVPFSKTKGSGTHFEVILRFRNSSHMHCIPI